LKRASVILTVTAWETYVEDKLSALFAARLAVASKPEDVQSAFRASAQAWLSSRSPKPNELEQWTGDRWKQRLRSDFRSELSQLHTPNAANIRALSRRFIGRDLTNSWCWRGTSAKAAAAKLDALIRLRGDLVHRAFHSGQGGDVKKRVATRAINLCERLVEATEASFPEPE